MWAYKVVTSIHVYTVYTMANCVYNLRSQIWIYARTYSFKRQYVPIFIFPQDQVELNLHIYTYNCTIRGLKCLISPADWWMNCAFDDTSMHFCILLEFATRKILGYRAIAYLSHGNNGGNFPKYPPLVVILFSSSVSRPWIRWLILHFQGRGMCTLNQRWAI
jgi:hypothetical protein